MIVTALWKMDRLTTTVIVITLGMLQAVEGATFRAPLHVLNSYAPAVSLLGVFAGYLAIDISNEQNLACGC